MELVVAILGLAFFASVIALPVYVVHRLRSSSTSMNQVPEDMRRADDGRDGTGGGGPGLGPFWPTG